MFQSITSFTVFVTLVSAVALTIPESSGFPNLSRLTGRIINGTDTTIEEIPYQISLQLKDYGHWCGGVIISKDWVLTAAHCVIDRGEFMIVAGTANQFEGGILRSIAQTIIHEDFGKGKTKINDIALLRTKEPFDFDKTINRISLFGKSEESKTGEIAVLTGWGKTANGYPDVLNLIEIPVISKSRCNDLYADIGGIGPGQICTEEIGKDACQGDSGGPVTIDRRLAGIVSWGRECATPNNPGVHTEIAYFRDWIKSHTGV